MNKGYLIYVAVVVGVFLCWFAAFAIMRRQTGDEPSDLKGFLFAGPLHFYLMRRQYRLSSAEILGWAVVLVLMLVAPLATRLLG